MFTTRLQQVQSQLSQQYDQAKNWVNKQLNSEPVLYVRDAMEGAVKASFGVYYIFDLGLSFLPQTSAFYNGFKFAKYTFTGLALGASTASSYFKRKLDIASQYTLDQIEKNQLKALEEVLVEVDKLLSNTQRLVREQNDLLKEAGYGDHLVKSLESKEEEKTTHDRSLFSKLKNSRPAYFASAAIEGFVKASMVHYIFDLASTITPTTQAFNVFKNVLIGGTFLTGTYQTYNQMRSDANFHEKLKLLKTKIASAYEKFELIKKMLGDKEGLLKTLDIGGKLNKEQVVIEIKDFKEIPNSNLKAKILQLTESKPAQGFRAATDGAVKASSVHYLFELALPTYPMIRSIAALISLVAGTIKSYEKRMSDAEFQKELKQLKDEIINISQLLDLAKQIMSQQVKFVEQNGLQTDATDLSYSIPAREAKAQTEPPLTKSEIELAKFEEGKRDSKMYSSLIKGSLFTKSPNPELQAMAEPLLAKEEKDDLGFIIIKNSTY